MGIERALRLRRSADFAHARQTGRHFRGRLLTLVVAPGSLAHNRYGFVCGRRLGKAVARNRARRLLREATRGLHPCLRPGHDLVLAAAPGMVGATLRETHVCLAQLFTRAGLLAGCAS